MLQPVTAKSVPTPTTIGDINTGLHIYLNPIAGSDEEGNETLERGAGNVSFQVLDQDGNVMKAEDLENEDGTPFENRLDVRGAPDDVKLLIFQAEAKLRTWIAGLTGLAEGRD